MATEWEGVHDGDRVGEENKEWWGCWGAGNAIWGRADIGMENIMWNIYTPYYEYLIISASRIMWACKLGHITVIHPSFEMLPY
jgi:hypothetical protein